MAHIKTFNISGVTTANNLSRVYRTTFKVNWTEYFLLVAPPIAHSYILRNPLVAIPSDEYVEKINRVLDETSPRTLTNYVMVQFILSWLPLLEEKYVDLIKWFSATLDQNFSQNRSEICYAETSKHYSVAMLAMYARSRSTKALRPLAEGMVRAIIDGLTDQIKENKWMDEAFKKVCTLLLVPLPFLEFPVFHESFPRSFLHGSIGSVIGHEISHSLDVNGRMFDGDGNQRTWWKKKWTEEYDKRAHCYVEQYGNIKIPKFNMSLNGTLSLGEATADNEGLKIAYRAHQKYLSKLNDSAKTETVDGFTQDQLFFLGFSQIWCSKSADFHLYEYLADPHPPDVYRVNMAATNSPSFAAAFHCSSKSKMNPKHRCSICFKPQHAVQRSRTTCDNTHSPRNEMNITTRLIRRW
ncbi:hypothetical protein GCK32_000678 [Trichostrongylus colubriformis]|uniref:Uncharacterized protein n=1 Tax=Trichostrongylus colubriformis TaxID=6319 RepID=A0AAN8FRL8_TRICO